MMLKAIATRGSITIPAEIREDKQGCLVCILGIALDRSPHFCAKTIGPLNPVEVERISTGVSDIHVMKREPEKARAKLLHQALGEVYRQFIRACHCPRVLNEVREG